MAVLLEDVGRELPQGRIVVEDVEAAAERREHEIVLAFLDRHIAHGNRRQVRAQPNPLLAAVNGKEQTELGPDEEQVGVDVILGKREHRVIVRQIAGDRPAPAAVGALVDVRLEVAVLGVLVKR